MSTTEHIAEDLRPLAQPIELLKLLPGNPRRGDVEAVMRSYGRFGQRKPIVARRDGTVIAGNHQLQAAQRLGWSHIAVVWTDDDDLTAKAFALADNRTGELGGYDNDALIRMIGSLPDLTGTGYSSDDLERLLASVSVSSAPYASSTGHDLGAVTATETQVEPRPSLADRFVVPPFSVLDARSGSWQARKRRWLDVGIRSEEGRGGDHLNFSDTILGLCRGGRASTNRALTLGSLSGRVANYHEQKNETEAQLGRELSNEEFEESWLVIPGEDGNLSTSGTSVFDPVLCELVYRWFSPAGGAVLDPFAGGSVRGVVAGLLGRSYLGIDLRAEQVSANREQAADIAPEVMPEWLEGDSLAVLPSIDRTDFDLVFSCPPYADLEVYSDDPADISNMPWDDFLGAYRRIIALAVERLAEHRFACFVVGDVREKNHGGRYRNLIGETVRAFADAGCSFYNEGVLVTPVGSLPVRISRQFAAGRKLGKTHQNVLVFVKGDPMRAAQACGDIQVELPDSLMLAGDADAPR